MKNSDWWVSIISKAEAMMKLFLILFSLGCGPKEAPKTVVPPTPPPAEPVAEEVVSEPEAPPEPEPIESNVSFNATLTYASGEVKSGKVIRVERSQDFYGEKDWYDSAGRITIYVESGSDAEDKTWDEIGKIKIVAGKIPADSSCIYESDWMPWLYICTLDTKSTAVTKDGKSWSIDSKYKWRFYFEDESVVDFWIQKHRALEQSAKEVTLDTANPEDRELYQKLQQQLREEVGSTMLRSIVIE